MISILTYRHLRSLLVWFALGAVILPCQMVSGQPVNRRGKAFPPINLPRAETGAAIEPALGAQLPTLADWYGKTANDLRATVKRDKSLHIDRGGHLHYVCAAAVVMDGSSATAWGSTGQIFTAPYSDAQIFLLHSKPGATKVIYLDFNGFTTSGTLWNSTYTGGANIVTPPYSIDGNTASFSSQELANIQVMWQSVSEDFAPFDVDVTTESPPGHIILPSTESGTATRLSPDSAITAASANTRSQEPWFQPGISLPWPSRAIRLR